MCCVLSELLKLAVSMMFFMNLGMQGEVGISKVRPSGVPIPSGKTVVVINFLYCVLGVYKKGITQLSISSNNFLAFVYLAFTST